MAKTVAKCDACSPTCKRCGKDRHTECECEFPLYSRYHTCCTVCRNQEDGETRYSLGIYAGRYCDTCWKRSGYRQEGKEGYDFLDAGEYYEADDY